MSNVASKDLCEELYMLSGWGGTERGWLNYGPQMGDEPSNNDWSLVTDELRDFPAYDLGYLLRKMPLKAQKGEMTGYLQLEPMEDNEWQVSYVWRYYEDEEAIYGAIADTPEDAAAKLALELLKSGVLAGEHQSSQRASTNPPQEEEEQ